MVLAKTKNNNRHIDLSNNIEPRNIPTHLWSVIYNKGDKNKTLWRNNSLFNKRCWESWTAAYKTMELEHALTLHAKRSTKRFNYLHVRYNVIKLLEHKRNIYLT